MSAFAGFLSCIAFDDGDLLQRAFVFSAFFLVGLQRVFCTCLRFILGVSNCTRLLRATCYVPRQLDVEESSLPFNWIASVRTNNEVIVAFQQSCECELASIYQVRVY